MPLTWETVRKLALALPEVEEGISYGTAAFRFRGKLFARLHQSGDSIVVRIDRDEKRLHPSRQTPSKAVLRLWSAFPTSYPSRLLLASNLGL